MFQNPKLKICHAAVLMALGINSQLVSAGEVSSSDKQPAELEEVTVKSTAEVPSYQAYTSTTATKIDAPLRDIPQTVNVITQEVIRDQSAQSLQDVLRNVPGVGFSNGDGQRDQVNIRGFSAIADQFVDGIRDDALYYRDLSNVEQVEVLKGPASVLYGRGSSGGLINRVTKKPQDKAFGSLTATVGSYDFYRIEADVNQPINEAAAFRIIGAKQDSHSFREEDFIDREFIAPSLSLNFSEATKLTLQLEHLDDRRLNDFGVPAINGRPVDVKRKTYYGSSNGKSDDYVQSRVTAGTAVLEHNFTDAVKVRNAFRAYKYDLDRNNTVAAFVNTSNSTVGRRYSTVQREEDGYFNQTDLTVKTRSLGFDHSLLFGMELGRQVKDNLNGNFSNPGAVDLYDPVLPRSLRTGFTQTANTTGISETSGFYAQDLISLTQNWKALIGARYDVFDQKAKSTTATGVVTRFNRVDYELSPRAGLVYQPNDFVSLYGSYTKSFQPSQENFTLAANNADLDPEKTTNYEIGAKMDFLDGNLSTMVSLFRLERTNIKSVNPANTSVLIPVGEQRTDGLELSLAGKLAQGWDITAGYAYMDAEIIDSPSTMSVPINTTAPSTLTPSPTVTLEGNRPSLTPRHSANVWLNHRFGEGFGFGGGAVFVGDVYTSASNAVKLPGYVRFDASAFYETKKYDVRLTINNIFDKEYFISAHGGADLYNTYGAPRSALLSLRLKY